MWFIAMLIWLIFPQGDDWLLKGYPGAKWKDIRTVSVSVRVLLCCDHEMDLLVSR